MPERLISSVIDSDPTDIDPKKVRGLEPTPNVQECTAGRFVGIGCSVWPIQIFDHLLEVYMWSETAALAPYQWVTDALKRVRLAHAL